MVAVKYLENWSLLSTCVSTVCAYSPVMYALPLFEAITDLETQPGGEPVFSVAGAFVRNTGLTLLSPPLLCCFHLCRASFTANE